MLGLLDQLEAENPEDRALAPKARLVLACPACRHDVAALLNSFTCMSATTMHRQPAELV